ncbi:serine hydrolase FSH [Hypoxylon argillaceum]|nr:serine hydrolase FSH [Hypoxylon argillaceum]
MQPLRLNDFSAKRFPWHYGGILSETSFLQDIFKQTVGDHEISFFYPSAPFPSVPTSSNEPTYAWRLNDPAARDIETFRYLSNILDKEAPFDGIVGFSQGDSVASLIAAFLERPGYHEDDLRLQKSYPQKIKTPIFHLISSTDPVMAEERCFRLVRRCEVPEDRVVVYTGSGFHRVPATRMTAQALSRFLTEVLDIEGDY